MLLTGYLLLKLLSIVSNDSMSFSRWFIGILYTFWRQAPCWLYVSRQKLWHVTYRESFVPTISTPHLLPPLTPSFILGSMSLWLNNNNNNNKKKLQCESCELNFIQGKMRTIAWETASQIPQKDWSEDTGQEGQHICDFGQGGHMPLSTHFGRSCC